MESALAIIARDTDQPLHARLLAMKMLAEASGWNKEKSQQQFVFNLGSTEAEL
jgi:hypothetical protein